jgi:hypothetical protein
VFNGHVATVTKVVGVFVRFRAPLQSKQPQREEPLPVHTDFDAAEETHGSSQV